MPRGIKQPWSPDRVELLDRAFEVTSLAELGRLEGFSSRQTFRGRLCQTDLYEEVFDAVYADGFRQRQA